MNAILKNNRITVEDYLQGELGYAVRLVRNRHCHDIQNLYLM